MTRFLVVPQWQGSPAARAMLLIDGAEAIAQDLPRSRTTVLPVPAEAGDAQGTGVLRLSSLRRTYDLITEAIGENSEPTITIGGDCSVTVAAVSALAGDLDDVALIWCDAHPDLHSTDTSPSGAFSGMALRATLGEPSLPLHPRVGIHAQRVVLVGARDIEPGEKDFLHEVSLTSLSVIDLSDSAALTRAVAATGATRVYIHIDVDVFDPAEISGVSAASPFGARVADLVAALRDIRSQFPVAGATIAGFAPRTPCLLYTSPSPRD